MYRASQIGYESSVTIFNRHGSPGSPLNPLWAGLSPVVYDEIFRHGKLSRRIFSVTDLIVVAKVDADVS